MQYSPHRIFIFPSESAGVTDVQIGPILWILVCLEPYEIKAIHEYDASSGSTSQGSGDIVTEKLCIFIVFNKESAHTVSAPYHVQYRLSSFRKNEERWLLRDPHDTSQFFWNQVPIIVFRYFPI